MSRNASAVLVAIAASVALYLLVLGLFERGDLAGGAASVPLAGVRTIAQALERKRPPADIEKGFVLSWRYLLPVGALIVGGAAVLGTALAGAALGIAGVTVEQLSLEQLQALSLLGIVTIGYAGAFTFGSWTGARCFRHGLWVAVAAPLVGAYAVRLPDIMAMRTTMPEQYAASFGDEGLAFAVVQATLGLALLLLPPTLLGFWYGRRQQVSEYMEYLVRVLPRRKREELIELVRKAAIAGAPDGSAPTAERMSQAASRYRTRLSRWKKHANAGGASTPSGGS